MGVNFLRYRKFHSLIRSFIRLFIHSLIHSLTHSFIYFHNHRNTGLVFSSLIFTVSNVENSARQYLKQILVYQGDFDDGDFTTNSSPPDAPPSVPPVPVYTDPLLHMQTSYNPTTRIQPSPSWPEKMNNNSSNGSNNKTDCSKNSRILDAILHNEQEGPETETGTESLPNKNKHLERQHLDSSQSVLENARSPDSGYSTMSLSNGDSSNHITDKDRTKMETSTSSLNAEADVTATTTKSSSNSTAVPSQPSSSSSSKKYHHVRSMSDFGMPQKLSQGQFSSTSVVSSKANSSMNNGDRSRSKSPLSASTSQLSSSFPSSSSFPGGFQHSTESGLSGASYFFHQPNQGESLKTFLASQDFQTCAELDRENAHFGIAEVMIEVMSKMGWERFVSQQQQRQQQHGLTEQHQQQQPISLAVSRSAGEERRGSVAGGEMMMQAVSVDPEFEDEIQQRIRIRLREKMSAAGGVRRRQPGMVTSTNSLDSWRGRRGASVEEEEGNSVMQEEGEGEEDGEDVGSESSGEFHDADMSEANSSNLGSQSNLNTMSGLSLSMASLYSGKY